MFSENSEDICIKIPDSIRIIATQALTYIPNCETLVLGSNSIYIFKDIFDVSKQTYLSHMKSIKFKCIPKYIDRDAFMFKSLNSKIAI